MRIRLFPLIMAAWVGLLPGLILAEKDEAQIAKERALASENAHEMVDHFAHFAELKDEATCMAILERFDTLALKELRKLVNVQEKAHYIDLTGFVVSQMMKTYHESELSSETVRDRLDELIRHYPRKEE